MRVVYHRLLARLDGWPRRIVAGSCLLIAAVSAARPANPGGGAATSPVVIAARNLGVGTTLTPGDVQLAHWPSGLAPPGGAVTTGSVVGRRLASPLARGEALTRTRLVGRELTADIAADHVASTVTVAGRVDALVHPGDRVDLLVAPADDPLTPHEGDAAAAVIAHDADVLAVLAGGDPEDTGTSTLVVSTTRSAALLLASISASRILAVMGRSP